MPNKYTRTFAPEEVLTEDEELETNPPTIPAGTTPAENDNWKKRYGDLRSFTQKQVNDLKAQLAELNEKLTVTATNKMDLPTTPEEVEEWAKKYPKVAAIVETIALTKAKSVNEGVETRLEAIRAREAKNDADAALLKLKGVHPDFDDIQNNEDFHTWLGTKSLRTQNTIYENDTDYQAAAETITLFKLETGFGKAPKARPNPKDNARDVPTRQNNRPSSTLEPLFTESQIEAMKGEEFAAREEEISKAIAEGRVTYDVTNAAREAAR